MAQASQSRDRIHLFPTSPLQTRLSAKELSSACPRVAFSFFTADQTSLSPQTATQQASVTGRRVIATCKETPQREFSGGEIHKPQDLSELKKLVTDLLEGQQSLVEEQGKLKEQLISLQTDKELYWDYNVSLLEEQGKLKEQLISLQTDKELYEDYNVTRRQGIYNVFSVVLLMLDNEVQKVLWNACVYDGFDADQLIGSEHIKPFKNANDVTYDRCYYWYFHHTEYSPGISSYSMFWEQKIGFHTTRRLKPLYQWTLTAESIAVASGLRHVMMIAEHNVLKMIKGMCRDEEQLTVDDLRNMCGLYITLLRPLRNRDIHLLEKALSVSSQQQQSKSDCTEEIINSGSGIVFNYSPLQFTSVDMYASPASDVLQDILANLNNIGNLGVVKDMLRAVCKFFLACLGEKEFVLADEVPGWFWSFSEACHMFVGSDDSHIFIVDG